MRQADKERKKFQSRIPLTLDPGNKTPKKIAKKFKKLKNIFLALFLGKSGRDRRRKREKSFCPEFRSQSTRARKFRKKIEKKIKKIKKPLSGIISIHKGLGEVEKERKIIVPNSVHTRPVEENCEKNNEIIQKIKKHFSGIISNQNGMRQAVKRRKKFQSRIPLTIDPGKKIPRKIAKKIKKLKNLFLVLFLAKTG